MIIMIMIMFPGADTDCTKSSMEVVLVQVLTCSLNKPVEQNMLSHYEERVSYVLWDGQKKSTLVVS